MFLPSWTFLKSHPKAFTRDAAWFVFRNISAAQLHFHSERRDAVSLLFLLYKACQFSLRSFAGGKRSVIMPGALDNKSDNNSSHLLS